MGFFVLQKTTPPTRATNKSPLPRTDAETNPNSGEPGLAPID
jgi:hypothetical protein